MTRCLSRTQTVKPLRIYEAFLETRNKKPGGQKRGGEGRSRMPGSYHLLKVARTIADLAGSENILGDHVGEAIQYRTMDRTLWA